MASHRNVHTIEANGSSPDRARAEMRRKLRLVAELERKAGEEVDRLCRLAQEQGRRIVDIAKEVGIQPSTAQMRAKKHWVRPKLGRPRKRPTLDEVAPRLDLADAH